jgi:hypothetical protein
MKRHPRSRRLLDEVPRSFAVLGRDAMSRITRRGFNRLAFAALIGAAAAPAQPTAARWAAPSASLPQNQVGDQLGWALDQVNSGAGDLTAKALAKRFGDDFLAVLPANDLLAVFTTYLAPNGPMRVARFEGPTNGDTVRAILATPVGDWRVTIGVDPDDDGRIDQLFFEPIVLPVAPPKTVTRWSQLDAVLGQIAPSVSFMAAEIVDAGIHPIHT